MEQLGVLKDRLEERQEETWKEVKDNLPTGLTERETRLAESCFRAGFVSGGLQGNAMAVDDCKGLAKRFEVALKRLRAYIYDRSGKELRQADQGMVDFIDEQLKGAKHAARTDHRSAW